MIMSSAHPLWDSETTEFPFFHHFKMAYLFLSFAQNFFSQRVPKTDKHPVYITYFRLEERIMREQKRARPCM